MKRLVLLGEGQGELDALPILARKILKGKEAGSLLFVDDDVIRTGSALGLVTWNKLENRVDCTEWVKRIRIASRRGNVGSVLAIYDGDARTFPAGSPTPFCPATAARLMADAAREAGAGTLFSLAVVFACAEYESWLVAGAESLVGQKFQDGRPILTPGVKFSADHPESRGKRWLEAHCESYRPTRDQGPLTELVDLNTVRAKSLRSFTRLEHAFDQLLPAVAAGSHISSPG